MKTLKASVLKRRTIATMVAFLVFAGSAGISQAEVISVRMKIAGYLCGN